MLFKADLVHEVTGPAGECIATLENDQFAEILTRFRKKNEEAAPLTLNDYDRLTLQTYQRLIGSLERYQHFIELGFSDHQKRPASQLLAMSLEAAAPQSKGITLKIENQALLEALDARLSYWPHKLYGIFSNVLMNAVKYTPAGGDVSVKFELAQQDGKDVLLFSVSDTGIGILPEDQANVIEGKRGQNALAQNIPGTGYGLQRVKKVVKGLRITSPLQPENIERPGTRIVCSLYLTPA